MDSNEHEVDTDMLPTAYTIKDVKERQALATFNEEIGSTYILYITDYTTDEAAAAVSTTPDLAFYSRRDWKEAATAFKYGARHNRMFPVILKGFHVKERKSAHACLMKLESTLAWEDRLRSTYDQHEANMLIEASITEGVAKAAFRTQKPFVPKSKCLPAKLTPEKIASLPRVTLEAALNRSLLGTTHIIDRHYNEAWIVPAVTIQVLLNTYELTAPVTAPGVSTPEDNEETV